MARETLAQLRARIAELERGTAELRSANEDLGRANERLAGLNAELAGANAELAERTETLAAELRSATEAAEPPSPTDSAESGPAEPTDEPTGSAGPEPTVARRASRGVARSILAGVLIVLGVVTTPVAIVVQYAHRELTDTEHFVSAYAPLVESEPVRAAITDAVVGAIETQVDLDAITGGVLDALGQLELPAEASAGLQLVKGPIVDGLHSMLLQLVDGVVRSEEFAGIWRESLRLTHAQLNATLSGTADAVTRIDGDTVSIELGPVLSSVRSQLVARGFELASAIPDDIELTLPVAEVKGIGQAKLAYALVGGLGFWLPIVAIALLAGGIAVAPRRRRAGWAIGGGVAILALMLLFGIGLGVGRSAALTAPVLSGDSIAVIYDAATGSLAAAIAWTVWLTAIGIVIAWALGPSRPARWLRGRVADGLRWTTARVRRSAVVAPED